MQKNSYLFHVLLTSGVRVEGVATSKNSKILGSASHCKNYFSRENQQLPGCQTITTAANSNSKKT